MWESLRLVVSVIAYPSISSRHGETVCVAGIRTDTVMTPEWVRLFPFRGRVTGPALRIHKWDEIELRAQPTPSDRRPESFKPDLESIEKVGSVDSKRGWQGRRAIVDPLRRFESMEQVIAEHRKSGLSLAVVAPGQILDLEVDARPSEAVEAQRKKALEQFNQGTLFDVGKPTSPLEPMPVDFYYVVRYPDESEPRRLKIIDWEINQAWRKWRGEYEQPEDAIRTKWLEVVAGPDRDVSFFVGNMHRFPEQFLVLGVFWPPKRTV